MMRGHVLRATIAAEVAPGVFRSERSVTFRYEGRNYAFLVDEHDVVKVVNDGHEEDALVVSVLTEGSDGVWVRFPREAANGDWNLKLPRTMARIERDAAGAAVKGGPS